jgi:hypothetical protein
MLHCVVELPNDWVCDGGKTVKPGSPGQTAVRSTQWFAILILIGGGETPDDPAG